jgi:hypothetical protein
MQSRNHPSGLTEIVAARTVDRILVLPGPFVALIFIPFAHLFVLSLLMAQSRRRVGKPDCRRPRQGHPASLSVLLAGARVVRSRHPLITGGRPLTFLIVLRGHNVASRMGAR